MKIAVSPENARNLPSSPAAVSSSRSAVEPTATMRPPLARAALSAAATSAETVPNSACILWPSVSSAFTGRKVPAPTCSVTLWMATPRAFSRASSAVGEMQPGGGRRHRALLGGKQGLVVGAVLLVGRAAGGDIGRQRHRAALGNGLVEHRTMEGK